VFVAFTDAHMQMTGNTKSLEELRALLGGLRFSERIISGAAGEDEGE
jgi:hypothetical protein